MTLNDEHVAFIIKTLHQRGLLLDGLHDEVVDHVCSAVEDYMNNGKNFAEALDLVIATFGHSEGIQQLQEETIISENFKLRLMIKNYLTIAVRNLRKQSFYTLINVFGLAVGLASCLLILLYVNQELSFDKHHREYERIYRVDAEIVFGANHHRLAVTPGPLAEALRHDFPEVQNVARFWNSGSALVKRTDQNFKETRVIMGDSSIFNVFTIPFIEGSPARALHEPNTMVISEAIAHKYFPGESALGQSLIVENKNNYKITGVYANMPVNSHFHFDMILSLVTAEYHKDQSWPDLSAVDFSKN